MTSPTRTFFLKTSSNNYESKTSNADFRLKTEHTPVELNDGVMGVSLVSCTFPQNQPNVHDATNTFVFGFDDTTLNSAVVVTSSHSFRWRVYNDSLGIWNDWQTYTASGAEIDTFTTLALLNTQLNTNFRAAYNAHTGRVGTEVTFSTTADGTYVELFTNSGPLRLEFEPVLGNYLTLLGFRNTGLYSLISHVAPPGSSYLYKATIPATAYIVGVPPGQYTITELAAFIEQVLLVGDPSLVITVSLSEFTVNDQRLTITCDQKIFFFGVNHGSTIGPLLGIGDDFDTSADIISPFTHFLSYVANLHGPTNVYLVSQLLAGRTTLDGDTGGITSIVKQIPITAGYRDLQVFMNNDNGIPDISFPKSRRKHFTEVDVRLLDHHNRTFQIGNGEIEVMWKLYY